MAHAFFSSPELLILTASQVSDRKSLQNLVRISRLLHDVFSGELWKALILDHHNAHSWHNDSSRLCLVQSKNMRHVKSITICRDTWRCMAAGSQDPVAIAVAGAIADVARHCPQLQNFELHGAPVSEELMEILASCPRLRDLRIVFNDSDYHGEQRLFCGLAWKSLGRFRTLRRLQLCRLSGDLKLWTGGIAEAMRANPYLEYLELGIQHRYLDELVAHDPALSFTSFFVDICDEFERLGSGEDRHRRLSCLKWLNLRRGIRLPEPETLRKAMDPSTLQGIYAYNFSEEFDPPLVPPQGWIAWESLSHHVMPNLRYLLLSMIDMDSWEHLPGLMQFRAEAVRNGSAKGLIGFHASITADDMRSGQHDEKGVLHHFWSPQRTSLYQLHGQFDRVPMFAIPDPAFEGPGQRIALEHLKKCTWLTHLGIRPVLNARRKKPEEWLPLFFEVLACLHNLEALWLPIADLGGFGMTRENQEGDVAAFALRIAETCPSLSYLRLGWEMPIMAGSWRIQRPMSPVTGEREVVVVRRSEAEDEEEMPAFFHLCENVGVSYFT